MSKPEDRSELRCFLMGKTGNGKSATGNTLLGSKLFQSSFSFSSVTTDTQIQEANRGIYKLKIMDSPGLFDTSQPESAVAKIIVQAVAQLSPGPHAFLFVIRAGRYTAEDAGVYSRLRALLDDRIKDYIIVIFTFSDEISKVDKTPTELIKEGPPKLKNLMADCNNRYILFDNNGDRDIKENQVNHFMKMLQEMNRQNKCQPYQCPSYAFVAEEIEAETKKRLGEVQKKELEMNEYYQKLELELKEKNQQLDQKEQELKKREEELLKRESVEMQKMADEIEYLKEQLALAEQMVGDAPVDPNQEEKILSLENQLAKLNSVVDLTKTAAAQIVAERNQRVQDLLKELEDLKETLADNEAKTELHQKGPLETNTQAQYTQLQMQRGNTEKKISEAQNAIVKTKENSQTGKRENTEIKVSEAQNTQVQIQENKQTGKQGNTEMKVIQAQNTQVQIQDNKQTGKQGNTEMKELQAQNTQVQIQENNQTGKRENTEIKESEAQNTLVNIQENNQIGSVNISSQQRQTTQPELAQKQKEDTGEDKLREISEKYEKEISELREQLKSLTELMAKQNQNANVINHVQANPTVRQQQSNKDEQKVKSGVCTII